ncbi:MAG: hypothetical protein RMK99_04965 [Anaerolineales bacterium]|nr:hypothetical protein [Anaerolineales bacterium]
MTMQTRNKSRLALVAGVAFALALVLVSPRAQTLIAGRLVFEGATDSFRYGGRVEDSGDVLVYIGTNWYDPEALQAYLAANSRRGRELIAQKQGEPVPVQITFARPQPPDKVRALVAQTGFQVESFIMVGRSTLTNRRGTYGQPNSLDGGLPIPERELIDPATGEELVFQGLMVLEGRVPASEAGLGSWLNHPEVYLVDTSEVEVLEVVRSVHTSVVAERNIQVSVGSPFWSLDW